MQRYHAFIDTFHDLDKMFVVFLYLIVYVPFINFPVMSGRVFLGTDDKVSCSRTQRSATYTWGQDQPPELLHSYVCMPFCMLEHIQMLEHMENIFSR